MPVDVLVRHIVLVIVVDDALRRRVGRGHMLRRRVLILSTRHHFGDGVRTRRQKRCLWTTVLHLYGDATVALIRLRE